MLTPVETFWLNWHVEHGPHAVARRARMVLRAETGAPSATLASELKTTEASIKRALRSFEVKRLEGFPRPALFLDEALDAARVDLAHARHVADLALRLFDLTARLHGLPPKLRPLLEAAALLHNVGVEVDEPNHHTAGRDLLRHMQLVGYSDSEQRLLACAVRFHRKRVRPNKEGLFGALTPAQQRRTLALSALLRVADGLDYSQSQTTRIENAVLAPRGLTLHLSGPHSEGDGERAVEKADLWEDTFHLELRIAAHLRPLAEQPLTPESAMRAVIQRALADQLTRWQKDEAAARAGEPLALKAVRAAARRSRAALTLFRPYLKKKRVKALRSALKPAEDVLGRVRDWDVLLADAKQYIADVTEAETLAPLITEWEARRQAALAEAALWLNSAESAALTDALAEFLREPPLRKGQDTRLIDNAELILLAPVAALAERAPAVGSHDPEAYHQLRLAVKHCRFALEFLAPAYGKPAEAILKDLMKAQDRLGALNDAHLARQRITALLNDRHDAQAQDYAVACESKIERQMLRFDEEWKAIHPVELRRRLTAMLGQIARAGYSSNKEGAL
jgi:CHAD domain-containing protein